MIGMTNEPMIYSSKTKDVLSKTKMYVETKGSVEIKTTTSMSHLKTLFREPIQVFLISYLGKGKIL